MKEMNPAMKKTIAWILALAMLSTSAMALAENTPPQMPQGENGQPPEMPNGQKPGNPPDSGMGGPGGQSGKPDSYDAVTTVSTDTEISGETIESTGKDENALLVTDGTTTVTNSTIVRDSDESTGGDQSSFYGVGAAVLTTGGTVSISDSTMTTDAKGGAGVFAYDHLYHAGYLWRHSRRWRRHALRQRFDRDDERRILRGDPFRPRKRHDGCGRRHVCRPGRRFSGRVCDGGYHDS